MSKPSKPSLRSFLLANPFGGWLFLLVFWKGKVRLAVWRRRECFEVVAVMFIRGEMDWVFIRLRFSIALTLFCLFRADDVFEVMDHFRINLRGVKLFEEHIPSFSA